MKTHKKNFLYNPLAGNFLSWFIASAIMMTFFNDKSSSPILIIIGVLVGSLGTTWLHSYREAERIEIKRQWIDHTVRFIVRSIIAIVISIFVQLLVVGPTREMLIPTAACTLYIASIFWLSFDFMLNMHRELPWNYISKAANAAGSDKLFQEKKLWWITSKVVFFIFAVLLYYRVLFSL